MSGAFSFKQSPEKTIHYDLSGPYGRAMSEIELKLRRTELRLVYARVDPEGWDARRLSETNIEGAWEAMRGWRQDHAEALRELAFQ